MTAQSDWLTSLEPRFPRLALGYRYEVQLGKMLDEKQVTGDHLRPYLRNVDVQWGRINTDALPQMDFDEPDRQKFSLRRGDILVCEGGEVGRAAVWDGVAGLEEVYYQKALHRLRPLDVQDEHPRYMYWCLHAAAAQNAYADGGKSTIAHLPADAFRRVRFPKPVRGQQERIANFLDEQTARIDGLIAEKEQLHDRVLELSYSEIRHLLTGGDASGPFATSGSTFVGQYPSHWALVPWKRLGRFTGGAGFPVEYQGDTSQELPFFKVKDLNSADLLQPLLETDSTVSRALAKKLGATVFPAGTVTFAKVGAALLLLRVRRLGRDACLDNNMMAFLPTPERIDSVFAQLALSYLPLDWLVNPGAVPSVSASQVGELKVAIPPLHEQRSIVQRVKQRVEAYKALYSHVSAHIERLREYRASLISAAVTGQLASLSEQRAA